MCSLASRPETAADAPARAEVRATISRWFWPALAVAGSGALVWHFHARSWYPIDDGNYAHVAERVASGEVLNLQVQDVHAGYINFLNAAAFRIFGVDLLSLRYPLAFASVAQAALVYLLVARRHRAVATVAAIGSIALGVVQFFNPTAHWYCGALTVGLVFWMTHGPAGRAIRLVGAGALVGFIALFRQPSGVWVGFGVLTLALAEASDGARGRHTVAARSLVAAMLAVLVLYGVSTREPTGALLLLIAPAAILGRQFAGIRTSTRATLAVLVPLGAGAAAAAAPLVAYHAVHHSLPQWWHDVVPAAAKLTTLEFFGQSWYAAASVAGLYQAVSTHDPAKWLNGLYWAALPLVPLLNGIGVLHQLRRNEPLEQLTFPVLAAFYAIVSLHFQIPIYLYYSAGICLAALLWQYAGSRRSLRVGWTATAAGLAAVAIVFHAGQPYWRTSLQILQGWRRTVPLVAGFDRCSLELDRDDRTRYSGLVSLIQREVPPDGTIFAVPSDAELYFLANRRNPFRYYNTALGVQTPDELRATLDELRAHPPALVTFRPDDKYNTPASGRIMAQVRSMYDRVATIYGVDVYRLRAGAP